MNTSPPDYEAFFAFTQRPFSLTPDPKFYFRSRSHSRSADMVRTMLATHDATIMLVAGDLGVGKTTLCRMLLAAPDRKCRATLVVNALLSPGDLLRLVLHDLGATIANQALSATIATASQSELMAALDNFLRDLRRANDSALVMVDEAHSLPVATMELVADIAARSVSHHGVFQFLLAGQPALGVSPQLRGGDHICRARLLPLEREECGRYVQHRLTAAGGAGVTFNAGAVDVLYALSGGVPRLVNLLCERALQEAATAKIKTIEAAMMQSAASALELVKLRQKRFRWYASPHVRPGLS